MESSVDTVASNSPGYTLSQIILYMLRLGTIGFGGPVALAGYMHRDLVEERHWITEADYREGLALAQLMPGPLAAQLAIYLGYVHYRVKGATLVGVAFVLPSFAMVVALGWAYTLYGGLSWMQAVFYGVGAAVIGIIAVSAYKLTRKSVGGDRLLWAIYLVAFAVTSRPGWSPGSCARHPDGCTKAACPRSPPPCRKPQESFLRSIGHCSPGSRSSSARPGLSYSARGLRSSRFSMAGW